MSADLLHDLVDHFHRLTRIRIDELGISGTAEKIGRTIDKWIQPARVAGRAGLADIPVRLACMALGLACVAEELLPESQFHILIRCICKLYLGSQDRNVKPLLKPWALFK